MQKKIDTLLFFIDEDFSRKGFNNSIMSQFKNCIIINSNRKQIWIEHKPQGIKTIFNRIPLIYSNIGKLNYLLSPFIFLLNNILFTLIYVYLYIKFVPTFVFVNGYMIPIFAGILSKISRKGKVYYIMGDWHPLNNSKKRILSYIANCIVFPCFDYLCCKLSYATIDYSKNISKLREKYWNKDITNKNFEYQFKLYDESIKNDKEKNNLCFIGLIREDCGLDIVIRNLRKIRERLNKDIKIKIIGAKTHGYEYFKKLVNHNDLDDSVIFLGFQKRENFPHLVSDCFCGINLVVSPNSYTSATIPGKFFDYIQFNVPILATEHIGIAKELLKRNELGICTELKDNKIIENIIKLYREQKKYQENIRNYISETSIDLKLYEVGS